MTFGHRIVAGIAACAVLGTGMALGSSPTARADWKGLTEVSHSRYVVSSDGSDVSVTTTLTITNVDTEVTPESPNGRWEYKAYTVNVPATAQNVQATSGGAPLQVTLEEGSAADVRSARIGFPKLLYGESRTIELTFSFPGADFRAKDTTRVGDGFAAFGALAQGDPGKVRLEIVAPSDMELRSSRGAFAPTKSGGDTVWTAEEATVDYGIWSFVVLRDPKTADERRVEVGGSRVTLLGLPGDEDWLDFGEGLLKERLPAIEALTGLPLSRQITVYEDLAAESAGNYGIDLAAGVAGAPQQLDRTTFTRQAVLAGFDEGRFPERWVREGLASFVTHRVSGEGETDLVEVDTGDENAQPLVAWGEEGGSSSAAEEEYAYRAAHGVLRILLDDLDDEAVTEVLSGALSGESAYELPGSTEGIAPTDQWRLLDLVEVRGGNTFAADAYLDWVLDDATKGRLDGRAPTRRAYSELDEKDGAWQPPRPLRAQMAAWEFDEANASIERFADVAALAGELQRSTADAGLAVPRGVQETYENAEGPDAVAETLRETDELLDSLTRVVASAEDDAGPLVGIGRRLLGTGGDLDRARSAFEAGDFDQLRRELADLQGERERAGRLGMGIVAGAAGLLIVVIGVVLLLRLRRRPVRGAPPRPPSSAAPGWGPGGDSPAPARVSRDSDPGGRQLGQPEQWRPPPQSPPRQGPPGPDPSGRPWPTSEPPPQRPGGQWPTSN